MGPKNGQRPRRVLPKSVHRKARKEIREAAEAEVKRVAERFADEFWAKWPKVIAKVVEDKGALVAFYEFPEEHWTHLRTTNLVGSTFAPVRVRTDLTKEPGSSEAGIATILKLL